MSKSVLKELYLDWKRDYFNHFCFGYFTGTTAAIILNTKEDPFIIGAKVGFAAISWPFVIPGIIASNISNRFYNKPDKY